MLTDVCSKYVRDPPNSMKPKIKSKEIKKPNRIVDRK